MPVFGVEANPWGWVALFDNRNRSARAGRRELTSLVPSWSGTHLWVLIEFVLESGVGHEGASFYPEGEGFEAGFGTLGGGRVG